MRLPGGLDGQVNVIAVHAPQAVAHGQSEGERVGNTTDLWQVLVHIRVIVEQVVKDRETTRRTARGAGAE